MTELLLNWLNKEIKLSKKITDIPKDFRTGYYFAELLNKTNHLPVISSYKNTTDQKDIIKNLHYLQNNLKDIGIILNEQCKNKILNADIYTSKIYLYKIKKLLESKHINLEQLYFKNSISLSKMYNSIYFKSDNEKYLKNMNKTPIYTSGITHYKYMKTYENDKYNKGGELYKEIKKEYAHLDLSEFDLDIILADIKDNESKIKYFKDYVLKSEDKQKKINRMKEDNEIRNWKTSLNGINNLKHRIAYKSINKVKKTQNLFNYYMNGHSVYLQTNSGNFEDKLSLYKTQKSGDNKDKEYNFEELEEKNRQEYKICQVALASIRQKLDENLKNRRNKEKRERQKLKDNYINVNINIAKNLKNKEIEKNNLKEYKKEDLTIENEKELKEKEDKLNATMDDKGISSHNSTYSKLTQGDYCTNLIKNSFLLHLNTNRIGNRINFFKTLLNSDKKDEKTLPEIKPKKELIDKNITIIKKEKEGFNKEEFFNTINKENYENHLKSIEKKKVKKKAKRDLVRPIVDQILEMTELIYNYKNENNVKLVDDEIWKDLTDKLISNELLNKSEDDIFIINNEEKDKDKDKEISKINEEKNNNSNINENEITENDKIEKSDNQIQKSRHIDVNSLYEDLYNDYLN